MATKVPFVSVAENVGKQIPPRTDGICRDKTKLMLELLQALPPPLCLLPITPGQLRDSPFPSYVWPDLYCMVVRMSWQDPPITGSITVRAKGPAGERHPVWVSEAHIWLMQQPHLQMRMRF